MTNDARNKAIHAKIPHKITEGMSNDEKRGYSSKMAKTDYGKGVKALAKRIANRPYPEGYSHYSKEAWMKRTGKK